MRDLVVTENITLDGVIEATEPFFAPAGQPGDMGDLESALRDQREHADAFLVGRVTFEQMRGYWPTLENDTSGVSDYLNQVAKYVVSDTLTDPAWAGTTVIRGSLAKEIGDLKAAPGRDIVLTGSITLVRQLIAAGLVDEYRLFVYPVVLGRGERLFAEAVGGPGLRLVETTPFRSGVVLLRYRVA